MASAERKTNGLRKNIKEVAGQIKDGRKPTYSDVVSLGVKFNEVDLVLDCARAWLYREQVDNLLEQAHTGKLEGVEPIASLNGDKKA